MATEIKVSLILVGDAFPPDEVTHLIGLAPTETWRAGELISQRGTKRYKCNGWKLTVGPRLGLDVGEQVKDLLDLLEPCRGKIEIAMQRYELEAEIACTIFTTDDQMPILNFKSETVSRIAILKADIDIDMYLVPVPPEKSIGP